MKGCIKFQRNGTKQGPAWKFSLDVAVRSCQHRDLVELRLRAHPGLDPWGDAGVVQPLAGFSMQSHGGNVGQREFPQCQPSSPNPSLCPWGNTWMSYLLPRKRCSSPTQITGIGKNKSPVVGSALPRMVPAALTRG